MESKTLDEVCEFIVDCLHSTALTQADGAPLVRTPNVGRGRLILDDVHRVSDEVYKERTRRATPEPNDLILAREAPAGNIAVVKRGQRVCLGQRTVHLRPDRKQVDPDFLCYYLLAPQQQGALLAGETGATSTHVNMRDIRRLLLKGLPELRTQKAIGQLLSAYDDLLENNRRRIQLLEQAARLLYKEWFIRLRFPGHQRVKIKDGVPEGWEMKTIGSIAPFQYGKALKKDDRVPGPYAVYGSSGVVGTHEKALVNGPGIIVGRKGNVGSVFWSESDFHPIDTVYYIKSEHCTTYLYHALLNTQFINTDVAVPGLNRDFAHSRELPIPDATILAFFEDHITVIRDQVDQLARYNAVLLQARDLLLPRLMNGESLI